MGHELPPREAYLYKRCDEVLHYIWDPIGVAGAPGARDEYDSYLPQVFALVRASSQLEPIVYYLVSVEQDSMGLPGNLDRSRLAAGAHVGWREWIWKRT